MKLLHPHYEYLNNSPYLPQYKYTHKKLLTLIQQSNGSTLIGDKG